VAAEYRSLSCAGQQPEPYDPDRIVRGLRNENQPMLTRIPPMNARDSGTELVLALACQNHGKSKDQAADRIGSFSDAGPGKESVFLIDRCLDGPFENAPGIENSQSQVNSRALNVTLQHDSLT